MQNIKTSDLLTLTAVALLAVLSLTLPSMSFAKGKVNTCEFYTNLPKWSLEEAIIFYHNNNGRKTIARNDSSGKIQACYSSYLDMRKMEKAVKAKHGTSPGGVIRKYELFVKYWEGEQYKVHSKRRDLLEQHGEWKLRNKINNAKRARQETVDHGIDGKIGKDRYSVAVYKHELSVRMVKENIESARESVERYTKEKQAWDANLANCEFRNELAKAELDFRVKAQKVVDGLCNNPKYFKAEKRLFGGFNISGTGRLGNANVPNIKASIKIGDNGHWEQTSGDIKPMAIFSKERHKELEEIAFKLLFNTWEDKRDPTENLEYYQNSLKEALAATPKSVEYYAKGVLMGEEYDKQLAEHDAEILKLETEFDEMLKLVDAEAGQGAKGFEASLADYLKTL